MTRIDVSARTTAATPSLSEPERFLPAPARPAGPDRWTSDLTIGPFHHEAVLTVGPMWRSGPRCGRAIACRSIAAFLREVVHAIDSQVPTTTVSEP